MVYCLAPIETKILEEIVVKSGNDNEKQANCFAAKKVSKLNHK